MNHCRVLSGKTVSIPAALAIGAIISLSATIVFSTFLVKLINSEILPFEKIGYGIMLLLLTSSFLGAETTYLSVKRRKLMVCTLSGLLFIIILLSITALFFGGQYEAVGVTCALVMAGSISAGLLGFKQKGKGRGHRIKRHHR